MTLWGILGIGFVHSSLFHCSFMWLFLCSLFGFFRHLHLSDSSIMWCVCYLFLHNKLSLCIQKKGFWGSEHCFGSKSAVVHFSSTCIVVWLSWLTPASSGWNSYIPVVIRFVHSGSRHLNISVSEMLFNWESFIKLEPPSLTLWPRWNFLPFSIRRGVETYIVQVCAHIMPVSTTTAVLTGILCVCILSCV